MWHERVGDCLGRHVTHTLVRTGISLYSKNVTTVIDKLSTLWKAGTAQIAGVGSRTIPNKRDGTMNIDAVEAAIRIDNVHFPVTELISIENTHNYCGGRVLPSGYMEVLEFSAGIYWNYFKFFILFFKGFVLDGASKRSTCPFRWGTDMECRDNTESTLGRFGSSCRFHIGVLVQRSRSTCGVSSHWTACVDQESQAHEKGSRRRNETGLVILMGSLFLENKAVSILSSGRIDGRSRIAGVGRFWERHAKR